MFVFEITPIPHDFFHFSLKIRQNYPSEQEKKFSKRIMGVEKTLFREGQIILEIQEKFDKHYEDFSSFIITD